MQASNSSKVQNKILVSRLLTRSGDQAWDFAIPITLMTVFPSQLSLVALLYLVSKLGSVVFQPWLSRVIDHWKRLNTAALGTFLQLASVLLVSFCISQLAIKSDSSLSIWSQPYLWPLLIGISLGTVTSTLGSGLMDIAVGSDWIPAAVPVHQLSEINGRLQRIDLLTEVLSPVLAGAVLALGNSHHSLKGFAFIAAWNLISFIPELLLLRNVFLSSPQLQTMTTRISKEARLSLADKFKAGWMDFKNQPAAPSMIAYAFLWLSALSPHGVLLTGFLKSDWALSETSLGIFRGLGAVFGLLATLVFAAVRRRFGLIVGSRIFIVFQALILVLSLPFFYTEAAQGWVFLSLILLSRIGLYGFSLGETEIRQRSIPEGMRGRINGVANALTSFATLILFAAGSLWAGQKHFAPMIILSVCAVSIGAIIFARWSLTQEKL